MKHVIDRIADWIKVSGDVSHEGRSFTVTSIHDSDSKFIAGIELCEGFEILTVNGEACGYSEIVLQIRDGEFTRIMPPEDPQEDGDCLDRLNVIYDRHMAAYPAPF